MLRYIQKYHFYILLFSILLVSEETEAQIDTHGYQLIFNTGGSPGLSDKNKIIIAEDIDLYDGYFNQLLNRKGAKPLVVLKDCLLPVDNLTAVAPPFVYNLYPINNDKFTVAELENALSAHLGFYLSSLHQHLYNQLSDSIKLIDTEVMQNALLRLNQLLEQHKYLSYSKKNNFVILKALTYRQEHILPEYLYQQALVLIQNRQTIPLNVRPNAKYVLYDPNKAYFVLLNYCQKYTQIDPKFAPINLKNLRKNKYTHLIVPVQGNKLPQLPDSAALLKQGIKLILLYMGNGGQIGETALARNADAVIMAPDNSELSQKLLAQLLFGGIGASGNLPPTLKPYFGENAALTSTAARLAYTIPEKVGIDSRILEQKLDSIVDMGILAGAFPGCQILIAKDRQVILHKTYGFRSYDSLQAVRVDDIYDLASVTKIAATMPLLMTLYDDAYLRVDKPLAVYYAPWRNSNKRHLTVREILAHQSGLTPWIPFYRQTLDTAGFPDTKYYRPDRKWRFKTPVADNLYLKNRYRKEIFGQINESPLLAEKKYAYSDLSFYVFPEIVADYYGKDFENCLQEKIYEPLGIYEMQFNPDKQKTGNRIVPTEDDRFFRHQLLHGRVHDEGAAMLGGISGHAGLFSTANDLAKLMQMYVQQGTYGGTRLIQDSTMRTFTRQQYPELDNRRAMGFDKPYIDNAQKTLANSYPATDASENSFGHGGYTGTFAWADPDAQLVFIFLSNRVYPTRNNSLLYKLNIRPALHQAVYDALPKNKLND